MKSFDSISKDEEMSTCDESRNYTINITGNIKNVFHVTKFFLKF